MHGRGSVTVAHGAHNPEAAGSIPAPATTKSKLHRNLPRGAPQASHEAKKQLLLFFVFCEPRRENCFKIFRGACPAIKFLFYFAGQRSIIFKCIMFMF